MKTMSQSKVQNTDQTKKDYAMSKGGTGPIYNLEQ